MTHCRKCNRQLRLPSPDGYGPVCRKTVAQVPTVERDLFGFNIERAAAQALERVLSRIDFLAWQARYDIRAAFRAARVRAGVWAS